MPLNWKARWLGEGRNVDLKWYHPDTSESLAKLVMDSYLLLGQVLICCAIQSLVKVHRNTCGGSMEVKQPTSYVSLCMCNALSWKSAQSVIRFACPLAMKALMYPMQSFMTVHCTMQRGLRGADVSVSPRVSPCSFLICPLMNIWVGLKYFVYIWNSQFVQTFVKLNKF